MFEYSGVAKFNTTVLPLTVAGLASGGSPYTLAAGLLLVPLNVAATSAGVKAEPSLHLTPVRIVKVSVLPPLDQAYAVASHGYDVPALIVSNSNQRFVHE